MHIGVPLETHAGETRVAATPETVKKLIASGFSVTVEAGAGTAASYLDADYAAAGATIAKTLKDALADTRAGMSAQEIGAGVVHPAEGETVDEATLRTFLDGKLAAYKIPERMIVTDEPLPRLGTGKIDRVALKDQYAR